MPITLKQVSADHGVSFIGRLTKVCRKNFYKASEALISTDKNKSQSHTNMPQHPTFSSDPSDDFSRLDKLVLLLLDYGFLHEDNVNELSYVMNALYPKESSELYEEANGSKPGEGENFYLTIADLFSRVQADSQFVRDYRNAISECLSSMSYGDIESKVDQIRSLREPEKPQSADSSEDAALTDEKILTLAKAEEYIESNADGECFNGCTEIDIEAAEKLASYEDILYLDVLKQVPLDCLKILVKHVGGYLSLNGLNQLSKEDAQCLAQFEGDLCLNGIHEISDEVAELLSQHKGDIELCNLSHITASCARALHHHEGIIHLDLLSGNTTCPDTFLLVAKNSPGVPSLNELSEGNAKLLVGLHEHLELNGLKDLKVETAEVLAKHTGIIQLNGIEDISTESLTALASFKGKEISFNGLSHISKQRASCFKDFKTELLRLDGIKVLEEESASILSDVTFKLSFLGLDTNAFEDLSETFAKFFTKLDRNLDFPNLKSIDAAAAQWLSKSKAMLLSFDALEELSPEVAQHLSKFEGKHLMLNGIKLLTDEVAGNLTNFKGITLSLDGVRDLSPKAAEHLANGGGRLSLKGLTELTDPVAKALSLFKGDLRLSDDLQQKVDAFK